METEVTVALVIRHDQNDVWPDRCQRPGGKKEAKKQLNGEVFAAFHFNHLGFSCPKMRPQDEIGCLGKGSNLTSCIGMHDVKE